MSVRKSLGSIEIISLSDWSHHTIMCKSECDSWENPQPLSSVHCSCDTLPFLCPQMVGCLFKWDWSYLHLCTAVHGDVTDMSQSLKTPHGLPSSGTSCKYSNYVKRHKKGGDPSGLHQCLSKLSYVANIELNSFRFVKCLHIMSASISPYGL